MEYKIGDYYDLTQNDKTIVSKKENNGYEDQYFNKEDIRWKILHIDEEKRRNVINIRRTNTARNNIKRKRRVQ